MNFQFLQVLSAAELDRVSALVSRLSFEDGKATARGSARAVKHNLQASRETPDPTEADQLVLAALGRNPEFQQFALPKRLVLPAFARYTPGMEYGRHLDSAVMGIEEHLRSDLACTLFLSDPGSYDGGELVLELASGEQEIKLSAGEAVVYDATMIHRVAPVTRGVRLVAVTWIQSMVRDSRIRDILYDLTRAQRRLEERDPEAALLINKSYQNLLRCAADF